MLTESTKKRIAEMVREEDKDPDLIFQYLHFEQHCFLWEKNKVVEYVKKLLADCS